MRANEFVFCRLCASAPCPKNKIDVFCGEGRGGCTQAKFMVFVKG